MKIMSRYILISICVEPRTFTMLMSISCDCLFKMLYNLHSLLNNIILCIL